MSFTDIIALEGEPESRLFDEEEGWGQEQRFLAKWIGEIELSTLGEILEPGSYEELIGSFDTIWPADFDPAALDDPENMDLDDFPTCFQHVPQVLLDRISGLSQAEIESASKQWVQSEELRDSSTAEDLAEYLQRLQEFLSKTSGPYYLLYGY